MNTYRKYVHNLLLSYSYQNNKVSHGFTYHLVSLVNTLHISVITLNLTSLITIYGTALDLVAFTIIENIIFVVR